MPDQATMEFIGVTTSRSSVLGLFPRWAGALGLGDARLLGTDLPLQAEPAAYRETVERIAADPAVRGALVTSHKVGLFTAARDRFDEVDRYALLCGEISCISKRDGRLIGHAKDPITARRALESMLDERHFARTGGHVLCLGAGGAGLALATVLMERDDQPSRLVMTDTRQERLDAVRDVHERVGARLRLDCVREATGDRLLGELPEASLVVNATGMGKDLPGSPLGATPSFPRGAVCWDLNYRGDLSFLWQARERAGQAGQAGQAGLRVDDGWRYFLHGWSEHIAEVFGLEFTPELFERLRAIAEGATPSR